MPYYRPGQWSQRWGSSNWSNNSNGYRNRPQGWTNKQEPFFWKCGNCGNVQSGSECKGCHTKYWHLQSWERVTKPEHTQRWNTPNQDQRTNPAGTNPPHQAISDIIYQLTNPKVGQDPADQDLIQAAQKLQKDLLARCTVEEKHRRLQSVVSKLEHRQKQLVKSQEEETKLHEKLQTLRQERTTLIKETEDLEAERQELLKAVNPQEGTGNPPFQDQGTGHHSETDTESTTSQDRRHKRPKNQHRRFPTQHSIPATGNPTLQPNPEQWAKDLTNLHPDIFQLLQQAVLTESNKRNLCPPADNAQPGYGFLGPNAGNMDTDGNATGSVIGSL